MRESITVVDVLASCWIVKPFHLVDCCLVSDGGAVVVTSSERARDLKNSPTYIWGFGEGHVRGPLESETLTTLGGRHASAVAGVGAKDIGFAELSSSRIKPQPIFSSASTRLILIDHNRV